MWRRNNNESEQRKNYVQYERHIQSDIFAILEMSLFYKTAIVSLFLFFFEKRNVRNGFLETVRPITRRQC